MARRPAKKIVETHLAGVERGIKSLQASDAAIIRSTRAGFSQIYNHVDRFMKLHETTDIEFRFIKEQIQRLEERVEHLEATGRS